MMPPGGACAGREMACGSRAHHSDKVRLRGAVVAVGAQVQHVPPRGQHRHDHLEVGHQILVNSHVILQYLQHSSVFLNALEA